VDLLYPWWYYCPLKWVLSCKIIKLSIIIIFTIVVSFYIHPAYLAFKDAPPVLNIFSSIALTFFAYEGFRVITNTAEDMKDPSKLMMKSMIVALLLVMILYISVTFAVFGNLTLDAIIKAQDYAFAEAAKPVFGELGFTIMAFAALSIYGIIHQRESLCSDQCNIRHGKKR